VGFPSALARGTEIGAFLVLGGPVSCLVNATVGVTMLVISGQIPWAMALISWGTWRVITDIRESYDGADNFSFVRVGLPV